MKKLSTLQRINEKMLEWVSKGEEETQDAHEHADALLIEALRALKTDQTSDLIEAIINAYSDVPKWYA